MARMRQTARGPLDRTRSVDRDHHSAQVVLKAPLRDDSTCVGCGTHGHFGSFAAGKKSTSGPDSIEGHSQPGGSTVRPSLKDTATSADRAGDKQCSNRTPDRTRHVPLLQPHLIQDRKMPRDDEEDWRAGRPVFGLLATVPESHVKDYLV